jgi:hypothetical protein
MTSPVVEMSHDFFSSRNVAYHFHIIMKIYHCRGANLIGLRVMGRVQVHFYENGPRIYSLNIRGIDM